MPKLCELLNLCMMQSSLPVSKQDLRRAVLQSATEGVEVLPRSHVGSAAKVNQLDVEVLVNDDVFILQVLANFLHLAIAC